MIDFNSISPDDVRREEMGGKEYLVFPLKPIKPMRLHRGYVPEQHVKKSTPDWNGTPLTLNHPRDAEGNFVSANSPEVAEKTWLGYAFNFPHKPQSEPEGEGWIDIQNARDIGGDAEEIIDRLENGDSVSVSSSYRGDKLEPGEYDGEHRDKVKGNIRPDHIAMLPNKEGVCSVDDGCMAGVAANAEVDRTPPQEAQRAGEIVKRLDDEYGVDAMRDEGWARTNQLVDGEELSWDVISRMSQFARHEDNTEYDNPSDVDISEMSDEEKAELADDNGTMAWFGWGAKAGVEWAQDMMDKRDEMSSNLLFQPADDGSATQHPEDTGEQHKEMQDDLTINKSIDGITFSGTTTSEIDESEIPNDDFEPHYVFDGEDKSDSSFPLVDADRNLAQPNVESAFNLRGHADDESKLLSVLREANGEFDDPPLDEADFEDAMSNNSLMSDIKSFLGINESAESDSEPTDMENDKVQFLVNERGYDEENLPPVESDCFDRLHSNEETLHEQEQDGDGGSQSNNEQLGDVMDQLDSMQDQMVTAEEVTEVVEEKLAANEQKEQKEALADDIIANSDDYDEEDKESLISENSKDVLETLANTVSDDDLPADRRGQIGASASSSSSDDADAWAAPTANAREEELESGD